MCKVVERYSNARHSVQMCVITIMCDLCLILILFVIAIKYNAH